MIGQIAMLSEAGKRDPPPGALHLIRDIRFRFRLAGREAGGAGRRGGAVRWEVGGWACGEGRPPGRAVGRVPPEPRSSSAGDTGPEPDRPVPVT